MAFGTTLRNCRSASARPKRYLQGKCVRTLRVHDSTVVVSVATKNLRIVALSFKAAT